MYLSLLTICKKEKECKSRSSDLLKQGARPINEDRIEVELETAKNNDKEPESISDICQIRLNNKVNFSRSESIALIIETPAALDEATLERIRSCTSAGFPICLENALSTMFGNDARHLLDLYFVRHGFFPKLFVSSPSEIWQIHEDYVERFEKLFGDDVAYVIENEIFRNMESMGCLQCPLSDAVLERLTHRK